ncbi:MAG: hypothetical protein ACYDH1_04810 [Anaerolineaceae bacterium]|nr:MAG: hypothetical protein CVU46_05050 [Chloroflexi bacterium HGW-Chloroflexi-8]
MDKRYKYEIRVTENLEAHWSDWFAGMDVQMASQGETILSGHLIDQAELIGLLYKIHALNLTIIAFRRIEIHQ